MVMTVVIVVVAAVGEPGADGHVPATWVCRLTPHARCGFELPLSREHFRIVGLSLWTPRLFVSTSPMGHDLLAL